MADPYTAGRGVVGLYARRRAVCGKVCAVMDGMLEDRGLELAGLPSRALRRSEIHELIATDEAGARPGQRVDHIAYLGFWEIEQGGVLLVGDSLTSGGRPLGIVAGFDMTHMPNHMNIVVVVPERRTGREIGLQLEDAVVTQPCDVD